MFFYDFDIPAQINGEQLKKELLCDEVYIRDDRLIIGGDLTREQAEEGLKNHVAVDETAIKIEARKALLTKLGITEDEARLLIS